MKSVIRNRKYIKIDKVTFEEYYGDFLKPFEYTVGENENLLSLHNLMTTPIYVWSNKRLRKIK